MIMYMQLSNTKKYMAASIGSLAALLLFFSFVSPESLPVAALTVPFLLVFITVYLIGMTLARLTHINAAQLIATITAVFVTLMLVLGSLHQLTIRDVLLGVAIIGLLTMYLRRLQQ